MTTAGAQTTTIGVVVHPHRPIDKALDALRKWAEGRGQVMRQVLVDGQDRRVAEPSDPGDCGLIVAVGGDGTVLAALHQAAPTNRPVLGVACGSLGALTSVQASDITEALDRVASGEAQARALPALSVECDGTHLGDAFNDLAVVRGGAGQVILDIDVDGGPYARIAGDGVVVATPLGSSAYTLAARGPLVTATDPLIVVTPLAPHAGNVPPLVVGGGTPLSIGVDGGWAGARIELDGRVVDTDGPQGMRRLNITLRPDAVRLYDLDGETLIAGLRRRGVIADTPRMRVRAAREHRGG